MIWKLFWSQNVPKILNNILKLRCQFWYLPQRASLACVGSQLVRPLGCAKQLCKLQSPILYCVSLIMVTITIHIFTDIFPREHFMAVISFVGNEKNMGYLLVSNLIKFEKKLNKNQTGLLQFCISLIRLKKFSVLKLVKNWKPGSKRFFFFFFFFTHPGKSSMRPV